MSSSLSNNSSLMLALGPAERQRLKHEQNIFFDRQLSKYRRFLWQITYPVARSKVHRQPRNILRIQKDLSGVGPLQSDDHIENRRLARAVRPQKSDDFVLMNIERYVVDDDSLAI